MRSAMQKVNQDSSGRQQEFFQKQLDAFSDKLDQNFHVLCSIMKYAQNFCNQDNTHEARQIGHDERMNMPKGIRLEFPKFDGNNSTGWVFKSIQFFDYYQTHDHQKLTMASYHVEEETLVW